MDTKIRDFCDHLLTKKSTLLVHLRSCDFGEIDLSYIENIYDTSRKFENVVPTGGCHADQRYAPRHEASAKLLGGIDLIYDYFSIGSNGDECKLRVLPNYLRIILMMLFTLSV